MVLILSAVIKSGKTPGDVVNTWNPPGRDTYIGDVEPAVSE